MKEIYVVVDSDNDYEVGTSEEDALSRFEEHFAGERNRTTYRFEITGLDAKIVGVSATLPEREDGLYVMEIKS